MVVGAADKRQLRRLVSSFPDQRLLVVGDFMLDRYIRGSVSRISPEAPVPVVHVSSESSIPGGAGNVASNLAALGARVACAGVIGDDEAGRLLRSDLGARGARIDGLLVDGARVTGQKCRVVAERQQVVRFDRESAEPLAAGTRARLLKLLPALVAESDAVILSDYGKGVIGEATVAASLSAAKRRGIPVTVDPKIENFKLYRRVTCITPNLHEAYGGMGRALKDGARDIEVLGRDILQALKTESVLITRGPDGMSLFKARGRLLHIPTRAREVFDVSGAGDTVIAALTLALAAGATIEQAAALSNYAAGVVVGKLGTATATAAELAEAIG